MNPARSLGPNIAAALFVDFDYRRGPNVLATSYLTAKSLWTYHWIYYAGPILGASLAAALYRLFLGRNKNRLL